MPFNGSGVFQRMRNWVADATAGIKIRADYHDAEDDGFAAGLTNCITRDGQSLITQNIPFNAKRATGLEDPVNAQDAATKAYADTKLSGSGGTINGNLDVAGRVSAFGYRTRKGLAGPYGDNWFNINWVAGTGAELWVDDYNYGVVATQAYANAQDAAIQAALQAQINTKQANLGFTPVEQGGGTGMAANKIRLGWDGAGIRHQVDNNDTMMYLPRSPNPTIAGNTITNGRLAHAGDIATATNPQSYMNEPWAGAVMSGWSWVIAGGVATTGAYRFRYVQLYSTTWYTVGYA